MAKQVSRKWMVCVVALGCLPVLAGEGQSIQKESSGPSIERSVPAQHCVATTESDGAATAEQDGVIAERLEIASLECYSTFSEAIFAATRGEVRLPEGENMATSLDRLDVELQRLELQRRESRLAEIHHEDDSPTAGSAELQREDDPPVTMATYILAVDYDRTFYLVSSISWTSASPCSPTSSKYVTSMPGFDDRVSSSRGYAPCNKNMFYEHANFGGAVKGCYPSCPTLGAMDNKASSRKWLY